MSKPIVAWRITSTRRQKTTDEEGFSEMNINFASGHNQVEDLKLIEWGVGSSQEAGSMAKINLYLSRTGLWYISASS